MNKFKTMNLKPLINPQVGDKVVDKDGKPFGRVICNDATYSPIIILNDNIEVSLIYLADCAGKNLDGKQQLYFAPKTYTIWFAVWMVVNSNHFYGNSFTSEKRRDDAIIGTYHKLIDTFEKEYADNN